jgi:hypothetical protein
MNINVKAPTTGRELDVDVAEKLITSAEEAIEAYGEEPIVNLINRQIVTDIRNGVRAKLNVEGDNEMTDEQVIEWVGGWVPGVRKAAKSKSEKAMDAFEGLDAVAQAELLQALQAKIASS